MYATVVPSTDCCIHTVVPANDRPRYDRNMYRFDEIY